MQLIFCGLIFIVCGLKLAEGKIDSSLQLVHVFFRHGSRAPENVDSFPLDKYKEETFRPMGYGQLSIVGKNRAHRLGLLLKRKYESFLGEIYFPELIESWSTDYDRTKMSALLVLAGLFPPSKKEMWATGISWQPIPYHYLPNKIDFSLRKATSFCPKYINELQKVLASEKAQQIVKDNEETFQYLANHTGRTVKTLDDVVSIYQTLYAEENLNLTIPEWTKSIYPKVVYDLAVHQMNFENYNSELKKLNGGPMLKVVIDHMLKKSSFTLTPKQRKMYLYSGHENNVINILAATNLFKPHFPSYSAAVLVELHYLADKETYAVKVLYARDVDAELETLKMDGCDELCPLDKFVELTKENVPTDYTKECESKINLDEHQFSDYF